MGDGGWENFCLTKPKRWRSLFAAWQEVDWLLANCLERWSNPIGGLMIRVVEPGLTDWWQHWLVGGIGACLMLFIACYRYENLIQWHWITESPIFP